MNVTSINKETENVNVLELATQFLAFKIGDFVNKYYFPVFVPIGITGNILSFLVMIQPHNRQNSMSIYLASLTIPDTIVLCLGFVSYLGMEYGVYVRPGPESYCRVSPFITFTCFLCSTLLILSMTFDRFYSIIMPHKAASFNTVKRTNITIACIVIFSILYNLPHMFLSTIINWDCIPYATAMGQAYGEFYYVATLLVQFALPFVSILVMNSVIIHKIRNRFIVTEEPSRDRTTKDSSQGETRSSEKQVFSILLLVTFSFLILTTPWYLFFLLIMFVDFSQTPRLLAEYYLFYNIGQKMQFTNHGINFFLYVISGKKFRSDLKRVFHCSNQLQENRESVVTAAERFTDMK